MHGLSGFLDIVILLGALQGFIFSGLLYFSKKRRLSDRLLAVLLLLVSIASLKLYGVGQGWFDLPPLHWLDTLVPLIVIMPVGPLIFFYVRSSIDPGFRLGKKDRRHFYPVLIDAVPQLTAIVFCLGVITHAIPNIPAPWVNFIDTYNVYSDIPRWASISYYILASVRLLTRTCTMATQPFPQKWLQQFTSVFLVFQIIWLLYLLPYIIPRYTDILLVTLDWYPVYVPLAVLIYFLGIKGYIASQQDIPVPKPAQAPRPLPGAEQTAALLQNVMETQKLYLDPMLTVARLAAYTGLSSKTISAVLNQHMHQSFNDFINGYRIRAIKERLLRGEAGSYTIAGLAYECGFNSLPTFQRAFKTISGQTPKEFLSGIKMAGS